MTIRLSGAVFLLALPVLARAGGYDPGEDRAALRRSAMASYQAAAEAAGRPLEPSKVAVIKTDLDECVAKADLAAGTAKTLEDMAVMRAGEMEKLLKRVKPAPEDLGRPRWTELGKKQDELAKKVDALPDKVAKDKDKKEEDNKEKARLKELLAESAGNLRDADSALTAAEEAAAAMASAADGMKDAMRRSKGPGEERSAADAEVGRLDAALPASVTEAKGAVDLLGKEPQAVNRTHAGGKLTATRSLAGELLSAADRACNRADDYAGRSRAFDRSQASYEEARKATEAKAASVKDLLDQGEKTQGRVRARLERD